MASRIALTWRLFSKQYLLVLFALTWLMIVAVRYRNFAAFVQEMGVNPHQIGYLSILESAIKMDTIPNALFIWFIAGLGPFIAVAVKPNRLRARYALIAWLLILLGWFGVVWAIDYQPWHL